MSDEGKGRVTDHMLQPPFKMDYLQFMKKWRAEEQNTIETFKVSMVFC